VLTSLPTANLAYSRDAPATSIGIAGKALGLRSRDYDTALCRHDIAVTGGANNVCIDTERGAQQ
jgi:hypothetical protein